MAIIAAIDIGSNAMRLSIAEAMRGEKLSYVQNFRESVRLGQDVFTEGIISEETAKRAFAALQKFNDLILENKVSLVRVVGTSALREARNRQAFIDLVTEQLGLHIEVISGEEEARLVHCAIENVCDLSKKVAMLIDIGGGSVEVSLTNNGDLVFSDSIKMGTVRLLTLLEEKKRTPKMFAQLVGKYVESIHKRLNTELGGQRIELCIGTGGNIEALAELCGAGNKKNELNTKDLITVAAELQNVSLDERIKMFNLKPDRADVIVPAAVVLLEILKHVKATQLIAPGVGLKDGVLYDLLPQAAESKASHHRAQVLAFTRAVGRKYRYDEIHADEVTRLALSLFDQTEELHGLGSEDKLLLEVASQLHDIGQIINLNGHHKHSYYIIEATPFIGITRKERDLVALIARYHRKSLPKKEHAEFGALDASEQEKVKVIAGILRIAEGLDRQQAKRVSKIIVTWDKASLYIEICGEGDLILERWAAANKSDLLQIALKKKIVVLDKTD